MPLKIDRILVPTDFSPCAGTALAQGLALARQHGATLCFLHVMMSHDEDPYSLVYQVADRHAIHQQQSELCRATMRELLEEHDTAGVEVEERRSRAFAIAPTILDTIETLDIDLVVMGAHGRRGLRRLLLGSIAEEVVRLAPCPVLTVREGSETVRVPPARIVVPVDFSPHSKRALGIAKRMAEVGTRLDLVHVVENPILPHAYDPQPGDAERFTFPVIARRVEEAIAGWLADLGGSEVVCQIEVLEGRAADAITDYAERSDADLIVIATHGLTGINRLFLGSVSERVVRMANCPVLTLKDQDAFAD